MAQQPSAEGQKRARARQLGGIVLAVLATLFAVLNLDKVSVNWIVGTWRTPLIVVIAASLLVGAAAGYLLARRGAQARA